MKFIIIEVDAVNEDMEECPLETLNLMKSTSLRIAVKDRETEARQQSGNAEIQRYTTVMNVEVLLNDKKESI